MVCFVGSAPRRAGERARWAFDCMNRAAAKSLQVGGRATVLVHDERGSWPVVGKKSATATRPSPQHASYEWNRALVQRFDCRFETETLRSDFEFDERPVN